MFGLVEKKIEKILKSEKKDIESLTKEKNKISIELDKLEQNIELFNDIKKNKINIMIGLIVAGCITIGSFLLPALPNIIYIISSIICGASIINEYDTLKSNKRYLAYDNIDANKDNYIELVDSYNKLNNKLNSIESILKTKNESVTEYAEIRSNITAIREYQSTLNGNSTDFKKASEYFTERPELVFDTEEEYDNYKSYNDSFIKKELVKNKLLEKRRINK